MWIDIDDAPFTDKEKETIKSLGVHSADWGHPKIVLDDPIKYFFDKKHQTDRLSVMNPPKQSRWIDEEIGRN